MQIKLYRLRQNINLIIAMFVMGMVLLFVMFSNKKPVITDLVNELHFSHESGFYDEDFFLSISSDVEGRIYYTLDGSEPGLDSYEYTEPLHIYDATKNENVYALRTDVSTIFRDDLLQIYSTNPKECSYVIPDYNIDKAMIVRAVVYYDETNHSDVKSATYFIGFDEKTGYEGVNTLSIITDPNNLFNYDTGIYVTGKTFDEYWASRVDSELEGRDLEGIWWPANYRNRGIEWERPAVCQFFNEDKELILSQSCGIRTHGGVSRGMYPRSLNLYAREEYDRNERFMRCLFDSNFWASTVTLTQGGGDNIAKLDDYLFADLVEGLNVSTMDFKPYVMFLDGEYWGVYWLTEKYDKEYISYHYGVYDENVIMIKNWQIEEGEDEEFEIYEEMYDTCAELDLTVDENYEEVCELIDIDSYIDYYASMLYVARQGDWPGGNYALWRTRETEMGQYGDCKWRWMVFDMNSECMSSDLIYADSIEAAMDKDPMFKNMMTNDEFRIALVERIYELQDTVFEVERVNKIIDEHIEVMQEAIKVDMKRFYGTDSIESYQNIVEDVRRFFVGRNESIDGILKQYR